MRCFLICSVLGLAIAACQKTSDTPIDPFHLPPFVSGLVIHPAVVNTDTMNVGPERLPTDSLTLNIEVIAKVSDPEGLQDIEEVRAKFYKPSSQTVTKSGFVVDDGRPPDQLAGDGVFSGQIPLKIIRTDIGDFRVEVSAQDKGGLQSNHLSSSLTILRLNRPPVLSDLRAPDSVSVSTSVVLIRLSIKATDPDGQSDIQKVYFNSYRPDGSLSAGGPFQMFDDGNINGASGDETAKDGVYSLTVQLPPTSQKGTYRFEFQAIDGSGAQSNVINHFLKVQ